MSRRALIVFALALLLAIAAAILLPRWPAAIKAWLLVWQLAMTPAAGAILLGLLGVLTPGPWHDELAGPARRLLLAFPLLALGLLPVLAGLDALYAWTDPVGRTADLVGKRGAWQTGPAFALRQIICLAVLSGLSLALAQGWLQDRARAGGAAIVAVLALTGLALDVSMSLDPRFNSTIFGLYVMAGQGAGAMAAVLLLRLAFDPAPLRSARPVWLLFGASALWGYFAFMQYLVVWSGDLPHLAGWFLARNQGGWLAVFGLVCLLFASPFALLLAPLRHRRGAVVAVAASVLAASLLESVWRIAPDLDLTRNGYAVAAMLILAGIGLAMAAGRRPILPGKEDVRA